MNKFMATINSSNHIVESPVESLVSDRLPRLVAIEGPLSEQTIYLDEPVIWIGRLMTNDISLDDPYVSRQHCLIRHEGGQFFIE
ncbi:MAG TPA: FHA domain-containing protein, partial [Pyrinomonadaceae bacterium]|nr:FHA domain-containing protein [Pyrinomonadaceae bacterium]